MANFNNIKHEIDQNVNTNGVQAITGAILNETLKDMIDEVDAKKQDTLVAGQNITIQGNVISATGGGSGEEYYAGHGIDIDSGNNISVDTQELAGYGLNNTDYQFNVDTSVIQGKLTAGANIQINGDTISATDTNTTYSAGSGLNLNGTTFSVDSSSLAGSGLEVDEFGALKTDPSLIQSKLTAGDGIEIDQSNEISVKAGSGLGFDSNGYLVNTGGGGGGQTLVAGDGIEIDSNDAINAKLGNGLQLDQNNSIEIDPSVVATQSDLSGKQDALTEGQGINIDSNNVISVDASDLAGNGLAVNQSGYLEPDFGVVASQSDLSSYLRNDASGQIQNFLDGTGDTELKIVDGSDEDYVKLGAYETSGEAPHIEIFENGSGDTKFFYDHIERGSQVSIDLPSSSGTIALTSDLAGKQDTLQAGANIQINGNTISATDTNTTYSAGSGLSLNGTTFSVDTSTIQEKLTAGQNITISGNVISATGGSGATYTAGNGINIDQNNEISVDASDLAGSGLMVDQNGALAVIGGGGSGLWVNGTGTNSLMAPATAASANTDASGEGALNAGIDDDHVPGAIRGSYAGGDYSASFGFANQALGDYSAAFGSSNTVNGMSSFAIGGGNSVPGDGSFAGGNLSTANGDYDFAFNGTTGTGGTNIAINGRVYSNGANNVALGGNVSLPGGQYPVSSAVALGGGTAVADNSLALGGETNGENSTALGKHSHTSNENEIGMGYYNKTYTSGNNDASVDTMFTLGNGEYNTGTGTATQKNAIEVKKNNDLYISGVGGFTGANSGSSDTLQTVLAGKQDTLTAGSGISIQNNVISATGGGGGTSFTPGDALELDQNDNLNVLYGSGLTVNGNNELEVDPSSITGFLPLQGGTLQNSVSEPDTRLELTSPGNGDCNIVAYANEIDSETTLSLNSGSISEREPGLFASSSDLMLSGGGQTGLDLFAGASYVEDNGTFTLDEFYSSTGVFAPDGAAEILLETNSSGLSDPGNETREARIGISDDRGSIELNPTGFSDGTYTLGFPTLSQDETIATLSDVPDINNSNSLYYRNGNIPEVVDTLNLYALQCQDLSGTPQTAICSVAPTSSASVCLYAEDEIDQYDQPTGNGIAKVNLSDTSGDIIVGTDGILDNNTGYKLRFPTLSQDDTIATLSDIQGGGQALVAGNGIDITNNTISVDNTIATVSDLGEYLPLTGGQLQADPNDAETLLDVAAPDSTSAISMSADTIDSKLALSADIENAGISDGDTFRTVLTNTGEIQVSAKTVNPLDPTDITPTAYTLVLPQKNDTIATLSDIQGGGSSYTAGAGIDITNDVISSKTFVNGTGNRSIKSITATTSSGYASIAIGDSADATHAEAVSLGYGAQAHATDSVAIGKIALTQGSSSVAILGQTNSSDSLALGYGALTGNSYEIAIGKHNNSISTGTTAEKTRFTVGNGASSFSRSNLIEAKQNNDLYIYGVGSFDGTNAGTSGVETLQAVLSGKQDTLTAGTGITITNNVISATGGGGGGSLWTNGTGTDSLVAPGTVSSSLSQDPASGNGAISCGYDTNADGVFSFASGAGSSANGNYSFAANNSTAAGDYSAAFGAAGANGTNSFAAVSGSADADYSVALAGGQVVYDDTDPNDIKNAQYGVAIGDSSVVEGEYGLAFMGGYAKGSHSVAIGDAASAMEMYSTALTGSSANGNYSFAASTGTANGHYSSAFGGGNAQGEGSLASGFATSAYGYCSAALGYSLSTYDQADGTTDSDPNAGEVALGRHNYSEQGIIFTVGCGYIDMTDPDNPEEVRENAVAIDSDGKIYLKGLGGYTGQSVSGCTDLVSFLNNL